MKSHVISCRPACVEDVKQVTKVHLAAFPGFFLTTLGPAFLRTMYKAFLLNKGGVFVVDDRDGHIQGFAVGVLKSAGKDRNLAVRFLPQLILSLIPAVVRNPVKVVKRITSQLFTTSERANIPKNAVILRSIGIQPSMQGGGAAGRLLQEFELRANEKGATSVALTTDALDNERAIRFYSKNGYKISQEFRQDGQRPMYLMTKELNKST